ncbi:MAG TPA: MrpF/PhaF family protein [Terriglobales bacterium]|nr:MrpF/PhaF family protein [Terriglobales bacterium]
MNPWLLASIGLAICLIPCGVAVFRGSPIERLLGLEMAGVIVSMFFITFSEALGNPNFYDLALASGLMAFGGGLVFARFLERWL